MSISGTQKINEMKQKLKDKNSDFVTNLVIPVDPDDDTPVPVPCFPTQKSKRILGRANSHCVFQTPKAYAVPVSAKTPKSNLGTVTTLQSQASMLHEKFQLPHEKNPSRQLNKFSLNMTNSSDFLTNFISAAENIAKPTAPKKSRQISTAVAGSRANKHLDSPPKPQINVQPASSNAINEAHQENEPPKLSSRFFTALSRKNQDAKKSDLKLKVLNLENLTRENFISSSVISDISPIISPKIQSQIISDEFDVNSPKGKWLQSPKNLQEQIQIFQKSKDSITHMAKLTPKHFQAKPKSSRGYRTTRISSATTNITSKEKTPQAKAELNNKLFDSTRLSKAPSQLTLFGDDSKQAFELQRYKSLSISIPASPTDRPFAPQTATHNALTTTPQSVRRGPPEIKRIDTIQEKQTSSSNNFPTKRTLSLNLAAFSNKQDDDATPKEKTVREKSLKEYVDDIKQKMRKLLGEDDGNGSPNGDKNLVKIEQKNIMSGIQGPKTGKAPKLARASLLKHADQAHKGVTDLLKNLKIIESQEKQPIFSNFDFLKVNQKVLNELDIATIREEYSKKSVSPLDINYSKIDDIIKELRFFSHLPAHTRKEILAQATYERFAPRKVLFRQGDIADMVYIILRGSVNVRAQQKMVFGVIEDLFVTVLYDGTCFGDYGVTKERKAITTEEQPQDDSSKQPSRPKKSFLEIEKRSATIEIGEPSDILLISRKIFQNIFMNLVQQEVDDKIRVLMTLPLFEGMDPFSLIPIANNLVPKVYKYKEIIMCRGNPIDRLRIIARGKCGLIIQNQRMLNLEPPINIKGRISKIRAFKLGLTQYLPDDEKSPERSPAERNSQRDEIVARDSTRRSFNYDKLAVSDNNVYYTENIPFGTMHAGEFFGTRGILTQEDIDEKPLLYSSKFDVDEMSRLTVIAESTEVAVLELNRENFALIPAYLQQIVKAGIIGTKEFDDFDMESEIRAIRDWSKLKNKELKEVYKAISRPHNTHFKKYE